MKEFILLRHGETDWAVQGLYYGHADCPLNDHGRNQAVTAGERLKNYLPFDHAYVSDLCRAKDTAALAFPSIMSWQADEIFRERNFGVWEGRHHEEIMKNDPKTWCAWCGDVWHFQLPGGESEVAFYDRSLKALDLLMSRTREGERTVLVAHSGMIRMLLCRMMDWPPENFWKLRLDPGLACRMQLSEGYPLLLGFGI